MMGSVTIANSEATFAEREFANAPFKLIIDCNDGLPPLRVFGDRPIDEAVRDLFKAAIHKCKPVPSVFGANHIRVQAPASAAP